MFSDGRLSGKIPSGRSVRKRETDRALMLSTLSKAVEGTSKKAHARCRVADRGYVRPVAFAPAAGSAADGPGGSTGGSVEACCS